MNNSMYSSLLMENLSEYLYDLTAPFDKDDIKWRTERKIKIGNEYQQKVIPYTDARTIFDRLDDVVPGQWDYHISDISYNEIRSPSNNDTLLQVGWKVKATLSICGVNREDVGTSFISYKSVDNLTKDEKEELKNYTDVNTKQKRIEELLAKKYLNEAAQLDVKTAESDAVKRVAMKFGIGRYLWRATKMILVKDNVDMFKIHENISEADWKYLEKLGNTYRINPKINQDNITYSLLKVVQSDPSKLEGIIQFLEEKNYEGLSKLMIRVQEAK